MKRFGLTLWRNTRTHRTPDKPLNNNKALFISFPIRKLDRYLPTINKFNPYLLNVSPVNYDFGFGSWLKEAAFFTSTMKINVDKSSNNVNSSVDKVDFQNQQTPQLLLTNSSSSSLSSQESIQSPPPNPSINKPVFLHSNDYAWLKHLLAGATAGVASRSCTAPLDRIKVLLQVKSAEIHSIRLCYRFIKEEGGYRSFWRGNGINCIKIAPEIAFRFMFYEQVRVVWRSITLFATFNKAL